MNYYSTFLTSIHICNVAHTHQILVFILPRLEMFFPDANLSAVQQKVTLIILILWQNMAIKYAMSTFSKTFAVTISLFTDFSLTSKVLMNFPLKLFSPTFSDYPVFQVSSHPDQEEICVNTDMGH